MGINWDNLDLDDLENEEVFPCDKCGKTFSDLIEYKGNLLCNECYKKEVNKEKMKKKNANNTTAKKNSQKTKLNKSKKQNNLGTDPIISISDLKKEIIEELKKDFNNKMKIMSLNISDVINYIIEKYNLKDFNRTITKKVRTKVQTANFFYYSSWIRSEQKLSFSQLRASLLINLIMKKTDLINMLLEILKVIITNILKE